MDEKTALVFEGGGGKGAFAQGVLSAIYDQSKNKHPIPIRVAGVSGTSVGALCAYIFAAGNTTYGENLWRKITRKSILPTRLQWILAWTLSPIIAYAHICHFSLSGHRMTFVMRLLSGLLIFSPIILLECVASRFRDIHTTPTMAIITICVLLIPSGYPGFVSRHTLLNLVIFNILYHIGLYFSTLHIISIIPTLAITTIAYIRTIDRLTTTSIFSDKMLRETIEKSPEKTIKIDCFSTVSSERPFDPRGAFPDSFASILLKTLYQDKYYNMAIFEPVYINIRELPNEHAANVLLASAALPFGILPPVEIGPSCAVTVEEMTSTIIQRRKYIDGGIADNLPCLPFLVDRTYNHIVVICLRPLNKRDMRQPDEQYFKQETAKKYCRLVTRQLAHTAWMSGNRFPCDLIRRHRRMIKSRVRECRFSVVAPPTPLGGWGLTSEMFFGTFNFESRHSQKLMVAGYRAGEKLLSQFSK